MKCISFSFIALFRNIYDIMPLGADHIITQYILRALKQYYLCKCDNRNTAIPEYELFSSHSKPKFLSVRTYKKKKHIPVIFLWTMQNFTTIFWQSIFYVHWFTLDCWDMSSLNVLDEDSSFLSCYSVFTGKYLLFLAQPDSMKNKMVWSFEMSLTTYLWVDTV